MASLEEQYLECFNNFIKHLKIIFTDEDTQETLNNIDTLSNDKKIYNGLLFVSLFDDEHFDLLINTKIKLFSHKNPKTQEISESLFGEELCLKNLLNNQPDDIKKLIWFNIQSIYLYAEQTKSIELQNLNRLDSLSDIINSENRNETKTKLREMLNVDVNNETSEMIDDIIKSFEGVVNNPGKKNPLGGIMDISQKISQKYSDKITNGDIELDKLMESITKKIPGMDKMMDKMKDGNIKDMMGGFMGGKKEEPKEKVLIDEDFSTACVPMGVIEEKKPSNFKIGSILKVADQFGVIPGPKKKSNNDNQNEESGDNINISDMLNFDNIPPQLGKVMEMFKKLDTVSTPEDDENMKNEMNTFLQNDLGINIDDFKEQFEEINKTISGVD
jgi:hypothetical protein